LPPKRHKFDNINDAFGKMIKLAMLSEQRPGTSDKATDAFPYFLVLAYDNGPHQDTSYEVVESRFENVEYGMRIFHACRDAYGNIKVIPSFKPGTNVYEWLGEDGE
jgi:hypothetical protein